VYSEDFTITRLPAANAPAIGPIVSVMGKFHGAITPTTPLG
jgi:hypothetical protein